MIVALQLKDKSFTEGKKLKELQKERTFKNEQKIMEHPFYS